MDEGSLEHDRTVESCCNEINLVQLLALAVLSKRVRQVMRNIELDIHWQATPPTEEEGLREWCVGPCKQIRHDRRPGRRRYLVAPQKKGGRLPLPGAPSGPDLLLAVGGPMLARTAYPFAFKHDAATALVRPSWSEENLAGGAGAPAAGTDGLAGDADSDSATSLHWYISPRGPPMQASS